jgi:hypothetical protein
MTPIQEWTLKALERYKSPTPQFIKIISDALLSTATFAMGLQVIEGSATANMIFTLVAVACKLLSNLFTVKKKCIYYS